ncbi:Regulatory protein AfsR [Actinosynnema sp. ALI-1.44]
MLFRVLGPLEVGEGGARVTRKPAALLAALLLDAGRWVEFDRLVAAVWPDGAAPRSALSNIKSYAWQLRRLLPATDGGPRLEGRPGAYRLRVEPGEVDVDRFRRHTVAARRAMAGGDVAEAVRHLEAASALWRGRPFAELAEDLVAPVVSELSELRWEVRETLADALTAQGRLREAVALLRELTTAEPLREGPWAGLVLALVRAGRRSEALATYDQARRVIADELGVDPGPELAAAYRRALTVPDLTAPDLAAPDLPTAPLRSDLPRAVPDFVGRDHEVGRLRALSRSGGVPVAVIDGVPGVGKTALAVHTAHLLADRYPDGRLYVALTDHSSPEETLARLLRAAGTRDIPASLEERAALWRATLAGRRVLLVLDNATDADQVSPLLPGSAGCMVLITTNTHLHLDAVTPITLSPLPATHTTTLFRSASGDRAATTEVLHEVVHHTGGLPSAIRMAATLFRSRPQWTGRHFGVHLSRTVKPAPTLLPTAG